jgi:L-ascorbate metabolism protein UlaG (beta-lactamase superfamily)
MILTYYGQSCFSVQTGDKVLLFDPFITPNELARHIDVADIKADYILLSHGHADHTADAVQIAKQNNATIIAGFEVAMWMNKQGCRKISPDEYWWKMDF